MSELLAFAPNYNHVIEIDVTPDATNPTWEYALYGIKSCDPTPNESVSEDEYYHNLGHTEPEVEKVDWTIALSGDRYFGDPAQDFVVGLVNEVGGGRKTHYRWTQPDGTVMQGNCTLRDIKPGMGDPSSKGAFSYTIAVTSIDEYTPASKNLLPESVTAQAVTVSKDGSSTVSATVTPSGANQKCFYAIEDTSKATVSSDGKVTGVAAGTTNLTVKAASKPSVTATVTVTVSSS